jgi:transposase-like protein
MRCVLIALGVWPERGRQEVLAWALTAAEDFMAWLGFPTRLEEAGIAVEHGLQVIIHDGGPGLCAALRFLDLGAAQQRCLFHKLRNIRQALKLPDDLDPGERRRRQRTIMRDFRTTVTYYALERQHPTWQRRLLSHDQSP